MTVSKALSLFDEGRKNSISEALKINWLSQLDMKIFCELLKPRIKGSFSGYTESTPKSTKLLAPEEYDEIYTAYLIMQSDLLNGETARYNCSSSVFNRLYYELSCFISREKRVLGACEIKAGGFYV